MNGSNFVKSYVMTTGVVFGLLTLAHIWRVIEEGPPEKVLDQPATERTRQFLSRLLV